MPPGTNRRSASRASVLVAAACAATLFATGCAALRRPAPPPPAPAAPLTGAQLEPLLHELERRDLQLVSMQSGAVMEYAAGDHHIKAREQITVSRPANLRVEAMSPFGVELILASHGKHLEIFEPSHHRFIRGVADASTLDRYARIPMEPADAVRLLMGLVPGMPELVAVAPQSITSQGAMTVAAWHGVDKGTRDLGFLDGRLAMVQERSADGRVIYDIRYSEYRDIGGLMFPYLVDADFPLAGSHVTFRYERPIVNGAVDSSMFVLKPPPGVQVSAQ